MEKRIKISIIIPVRNEEKYIKKCIDSILKQTYPKDLIEILIIDGMSEDSTRERINAYIAKGENIKLILNEKKIAPTAMNIGIKNATGDAMFILGGHSYLDPNYITECVETLNRTDADCVGGPISTIGEDKVSRAISLAMSSSFGVGNALFRYSKKECYVDTLAFGMYRREIFNEIGLFDEELVRNQDDEFNYRLIKKGKKILLNPDIKSYYYSRASLKNLWKQYFQYGFWKVKVIQKHKKPASFRHLVPMSFVLSIIGTLIGSFIYSPVKYLLAIILGSYFIFNIFFTIKLAIKERASEVIYIPLIFLILHLSYGFGFIFGIINFYILKNNVLTEKNKELSR